ncbi:unnamed protein product [Tilletia laevis]|uniref:Uncharacterized protein n=2 Tax=Tilletia TaxID=13289 RepID=A0A8T8SG03_9BASI|nr:hypothetical protein CF336_g8977 [Tilletia laevis]KAE8239084.1 hypothetical protein A4X03_0g8708 [Tilletia caries]CAD6914930.1 unnamed protein product [Tilletia laevis]CAD6919206.1 unnamed protein product [Tilletia caries]CAD6943801.1 unnamed protein product [Tilletia caries]
MATAGPSSASASASASASGAGGSTAPLALTLTWEASPNPRTRRTPNTARAHQQEQQQQQQQQQHRFAPPSISYNGIPITDSVDPQQQQLDDHPWGSSLPPPQPSLTNADEITALLPLSMERILLALPTGSLTTRSLAHLANTQALTALPRSESDTETTSSTPTRLGGRITHLQQLHLPTNHSRRNRLASSPANPAGGVLKLVVGTTEEGELLLWDAATLTLFAELPLFSCPIQSVILLDLDSPSSSSGSSSTPRSHSRLNGSLACAATDGTLAILHLDLSPSSSSSVGPTHDVQLSLQHIIPSRGPSAPLQTLFLRNAELLLLYADTRARLWDTASSFSLDPSSSSSTMGVGLGGAELRRSIGAEQAESLVEDDNKAFEGLYGAHSAGTLPRPTSLFAPSSASSQPHPPPPPPASSASHFAGGNHLAPPSTARSGFGTPDSGRPRFAAASHAAHALLGLNGGSHSPFASRTASGTASPNPAGPVVPTQRWVAFDFTSSSSSSAAAAGVLSFLEEYEEGEGETFTLRADFRRAIEAAAKALIPKGAPSAPAPSSSSPHGKKTKNVAVSSPAAVKALGILWPVLVVLVPTKRDGLDGREVEEAWGKLGDLVRVDIRSFRAQAEKKGKGRPRLGQLL